MDAVERVRQHYDQYPYPYYPWYARARWHQLESVDFKSWKISRGVRDAWIAGCGSISPLMFGRRNPSVRIVASDLSEKSLKILAWRQLLYGIHNVLRRQENLLESDYHEAFDAIDCFGVLHHLPDPSQGLRILAKALRPQGVLRLMLYDREKRKDLEKWRQELIEKSISDLAEVDRFLKERGIERTGDLSSQVGMADALLHPLVWTYDRAELDRLLKSVPELRVRDIRDQSNFVIFCEKLGS